MLPAATERTIRKQKTAFEVRKHSHSSNSNCSAVVPSPFLLLLPMSIPILRASTTSCGTTHRFDQHVPAATVYWINRLGRFSKFSTRKAPRLAANVSSVAPRRVRHRSSWSISRKRRDKNENYLSKILLCDAFILAPAVFRNTICARIRQRQLRPQQAVASKSKDSFFRSASHESNIHTLLEQDANNDDDRKLPAKEMSLPEADAKVPMDKNHCQTVALEKSMCPFVEPAPCKRTAHGAAV